MKLSVTRRALGQINESLTFIREQSPQGSKSVAARLEAIIDLLKAQPLAGRQTTRKNIRRISLTPYPYVIFYRVSANEVIILRLLHASRRSAADE